jgi:hypothetical protein
VSSTFPLLFKQRALLCILVNEHHAHHRELKNEGRHQCTFNIGDIVIVQKQVKSKKQNLISAKLIFKHIKSFGSIWRISAFVEMLVFW